ncbi:MAG: gliding motility-associated C-terminal domain-containing protein [Saprospiraceae bacterium]
MKKYIPVLFISVLFSLPLIAQFGVGGDEQVFPFERVYPATMEDHFTIDLDTLQGGSFITMAAERNSNQEIKGMNVTSFDGKGNINWTMTYSIKRGQDFTILGDIEVVGDDSLVFTSILDTITYQRIITKIGADGGYGWSKLLNGQGSTNQNYTGGYELVAVADKKMMEVSQYINGGNVDVYFLLMNINGEEVLSKSFSTGETDILADVLVTQDTTIAILSHTGAKIILSEMDTLGNILSSRSYESPLDNVTGMTARKLTQLTNGDFAIVGDITQNNGSVQNLILHLDRGGDVKTGHVIGTTTGNVNILDIDARPDSSILFMGFTNVIEGEGEPYIAQLNLDSTLGWNSVSFRSVPKDINGFAATKDGGAIMYVSGGTRRTEERVTPYLIRYDKIGARNGLCFEQKLNMTLAFTDITMSEITLAETAVVTLTDTITLKDEEYQGFMPPILSLRDTTYCPQDPIDFPLDATVEGGLGYFWKGEFERTEDPRIVVAKMAGEYSVTVSGRNNEGITCWTLCDTTNITQKEFPMVQIVPNFASYCETGMAILGVSANNAIVEIEWSTGLTQETRLGVTEGGMYSVTIVDDCGNQGSASINISQADLNIELPLVANIEDTYCTLGAVRISLVNFNANPAGLTWSNGESGVTSILVSQPGDYSVMFEGFCSGMADISVSASFFLEDGSISINQSCGANSIILLATEENIESREWSTGNIGLSISVTEPNTYTVTGIDPCGDPIIAEIEITQNDLDNCGVEPPITGDECMEYPNAFVPNSKDEINRIFAPKSDCTDLESYVLKIYNRWGNKVFESEQVNLGWDGRKGNKDAPADVYFFYSTYSTTGGAIFEEKGDLLLIR